ncbi:hypothetical protein [uncultured Roseibium sp.]|uniref:hypothetical protein n=1 Tax=uncultured Roseibium sp. TaxID=1936171 RepID=UPI00260A24F0|nr:hypothetical protein [uncultured Roseibium sp.]
MSIQLELRVEAQKPIYRGHDHYWTVIRDLGRNGNLFTFQEIDLRCNDTDGECIGEFLRRLIRRDRCLNWQTKPRAITNATRTKMYHACRNGCPHSRLKGGGNVS